MTIFTRCRCGGNSRQHVDMYCKIYARCGCRRGDAVGDAFPPLAARHHPPPHRCRRLAGRNARTVRLFTIIFTACFHHRSQTTALPLRFLHRSRTHAQASPAQSRPARPDSAWHRSALDAPSRSHSVSPHLGTQTRNGRKHCLCLPHTCARQRHTRTGAITRVYDDDGWPCAFKCVRTRHTLMDFVCSARISLPFVARRSLSLRTHGRNI